MFTIAHVKALGENSAITEASKSSQRPHPDEVASVVVRTTI
jgi:hypothetical protein